MVKIGFIVEGDTEKLIIDSLQFREKLKELNLLVCDPVINAKGNGNLLPRYLPQHIAAINANANPDLIMIVTDLEESITPQEVRDRIRSNHIPDDLIIVSIKAIESWFLSDSKSISNWLGLPYTELNPETNHGMPWDRLRELSMELTGRGPGRLKKLFAKKYIEAHGFCVFSAANHARCTSAREFKAKLMDAGSIL